MDIQLFDGLHCMGGIFSFLLEQRRFDSANSTNFEVAVKLLNIIKNDNQCHIIMRMHTNTQNSQNFITFFKINTCSQQ